MKIKRGFLNKRGIAFKTLMMLVIAIMLGLAFFVALRAVIRGFAA